LELVEAGLVRDISGEVEPWIGDLNEAAVGMYQVDGVQYGIPFDLGMVGFWYNTELFEQAGIDAPPATWAEFLEDVQTLKDAGITPLALGEGDKWPGMFWWAYLALRIGGGDALLQAGEDGSFDAEPFVQAGAELQRLVEMEPFQPGFMAAVWDGAGGQAATVANGDAAMMLMGQWAPGTINANSPDGEGLGENLAWFPFPEVEGGAGAPTDVFGGGNGFAVGKDAPPEAVDFLRYATSIDVANRWGETNSGILPVTVGADASITDPNLAGVLEARANATYVQLYLDQAYPPELGAVINDAVAELYGGQASPEQVAQTIADAAGA
jgi:raffinose/stachyose/melibiose transport system substrate-binding protein